ncbi:MAG: glycosyltransferase [Bacteroidota bacterium]
MSSNHNRVIHLVDSLSRINFGVWNAMSVNFQILGITKQEIWTFDNPEGYSDIVGIKVFLISSRKEIKDVPDETVTISHGCWKSPTVLGERLKKGNKSWIAIPQGMLEPWSMQQKKWKKAIYFHLIEKKRLKKADALVAVSSVEKENLNKLFPNQKVVHIPNAIITQHYKKKAERPINFLFMARLHHKKGILPLVKAWLQSSLFGNPNYHLTIAGPDHGEKIKIDRLIQHLDLSKANLNLMGAVYSGKKSDVLHRAHFYILPSFSEGFPSSLLEAVTHGCVPIYTVGCNFPEGVEAEVGVLTGNSEIELIQKLDELGKWTIAKIRQESLIAKEFVDEHYSSDLIGDKYEKLLNIK